VVKAKRILKESEQEIQIKKGEVDISVNIPVDYINTNYKDKKAYSLGAILYNKYPLLENSNGNYSENVISLRLFDEKKEMFPVSNLTEPIRIKFKRTDKEYKFCLFLNETNISNYRWDNSSCNTTVYEDYILCECSHLTDFTISKFNPVADILHILADIRIINSWEEFKSLNSKNAWVLYFMSSLMIVYLILFYYAVNWDVKNREDFCLQEVPVYQKTCSRQILIGDILVVKRFVDLKIEFLKRKLLIKFFKSKKADFEFFTLVSNKIEKRKTLKKKQVQDIKITSEIASTEGGNDIISHFSKDTKESKFQLYI
jgi:hypothetical protein